MPYLLKVLIRIKLAPQILISKSLLCVRESLFLQQSCQLCDHWLDVPDDHIILGSRILLDVESSVEEDLLEHA